MNIKSDYSNRYLVGLQGYYTLITVFAVTFQHFIQKVISDNDQIQETSIKLYYKFLFGYWVLLLNHQMVIQGRYFCLKSIVNSRHKMVKQQLAQECIIVMFQYVYNIVIFMALKIEYPFYIPQCFSQKYDSEIDILKFISQVHFAKIVNLVLLLLCDNICQYNKISKLLLIIAAVYRLFHAINSIIKQTYSQINQSTCGMCQLYLFQLGANSNFKASSEQIIKSIPVLIYDLFTYLMFGGVLTGITNYLGQLSEQDCSSRKSIWQVILDFSGSLICSLFLKMLGHSVVYQRVFTFPIFQLLGEGYQFIYQTSTIFITSLLQEFQSIEFGPFNYYMVIIIITGIIFLSGVIGLCLSLLTERITWKFIQNLDG